MFLQKFFQFLTGYVILLLKGHSIERFLNICMKRNIKIFSVKHLSASKTQIRISARDFKKIRPIAYKTHTRVRIQKKCGIFNLWRRYKKRVPFLAGFLFLVVFFAITARFVWSIEIKGAGDNNVGEILYAAELAGVRVGAYKPSLPKGNEIKNIILTNTHNITWAWVYLKGTKAVIEVREGIHPPKLVDKNAPCDIFANRDGIIKKVTVKEGIAFCSEGDVVMRGDLLIGGTYGDEEKGYRLEHAMGEILAKTCYTQTAKIKLYREKRIKTGRKKSYTDVVFFSKYIPLYKNVKIPYEEYSITEKRRELKWGKDGYLGIEVVTNVYEEEYIERIELSREEALEGAKHKLEEEIAKRLLPFSTLSHKEISHKILDGETMEVAVTMEFIEKIGEEVPIGYNTQE